MSLSVPASPFDRIAKRRPDGTEYWSARDLMPLMGYARWNEFLNPINRAFKTAENQGHDVENLFRRSTEKGTGGRPREEIYMVRFAAYLVAMNGDPNIPEVAAAQAYFAIQTRIAETQAPRELSRRDLALMIIEAEDAKEAALQRAQELEGPAAQAETFRQADGLRTIGDLANDLKVHAASNFPDVKIRQDDVFDLAGRVGLIIRGNTVRHNQPTAKAIESGWVRPKDTPVQTKNHGSFVKVSARLTPRGYGRLWDAAIQNLRTHNVVLPPLSKEIAA